MVVPPGSESLLESRADGDDVITEFNIREKRLLDSGELERSIYYFKAEDNEDFIEKNYSSFKMATVNTPIGRRLMQITDELYRNGLTNRNPENMDRNLEEKKVNLVKYKSETSCGASR